MSQSFVYVLADAIWKKKKKKKQQQQRKIDKHETKDASLYMHCIDSVNIRPFNAICFFASPIRHCPGNWRHTFAIETMK